MVEVMHAMERASAKSRWAKDRERRRIKKPTPSIPRPLSRLIYHINVWHDGKVKLFLPDYITNQGFEGTSELQSRCFLLVLRKFEDTETIANRLLQAETRAAITYKNPGGVSKCIPEQAMIKTTMHIFRLPGTADAAKAVKAIALNVVTASVVKAVPLENEAGSVVTASVVKAVPLENEAGSVVKNANATDAIDSGPDIANNDKTSEIDAIKDMSDFTSDVDTTNDAITVTKSALKVGANKKQRTAGFTTIDSTDSNACIPSAGDVRGDAITTGTSTKQRADVLAASTDKVLAPDLAKDPSTKALPFCVPSTKSAIVRASVNKPLVNNKHTTKYIMMLTTPTGFPLNSKNFFHALKDITPLGCVMGAHYPIMMHKTGWRSLQIHPIDNWGKWKHIGMGKDPEADPHMLRISVAQASTAGE